MGFRDYQKIYDIKKAEKLLDKHSILKQDQKNKNKKVIDHEKKKEKGKK